MSERNDAELVLQTFSKAFKKVKDVTGLIVHSDQGTQYTSYKYHDINGRPQRKLNKLTPVRYRNQLIV